MESNDKSKEINTCYCFNDIIKFEDFNLDSIWIDEKSYQNVLVYNISFKNLIAAKPLRIRFDKIDRFIRVLFIRYYATFNFWKTQNMFELY